MSETTERLDIRLPVAAKRLLMEAADVSGNTMTALVLNAALDKARTILETHRHFTLSAADWRAFVAALDEPPEPNDALKAAWRDYHDAGLGDADLGNPEPDIAASW